MIRPTGSAARRGPVAAAVVAVVLAGAGTTALAAGLTGPSGPPSPSRTTAAAAPSATPVPSAAATPPPAVPGKAPAAAAAAQDLDAKTLPRRRPVRLDIPSIGVASPPLIELGTEADGSLEVPVDFGVAGWFAAGPAAGQFGPAVIAGHVDSKDGPGIFYRLGALKKGALVTVTRDDGTKAQFVVDKVERYAKDRFPTAAVYGDTTHRSELRLITCGGDFDTASGHYVDNVVAYAHLL